MIRHGTLVIGIGNPDCGDDGVGRAIASRLRALAPEGIRVLEADGAATALLAHFADADDVVLVDAAVSGAAPGTVHRIDAHAGAVPGKSGMSTHGFGLGEAIELARTLGQLPRRCVVYAIEGRSFALGDRLSAEVEAAVAEVIGRVLGDLSEEVG